MLAPVWIVETDPDWEVLPEPTEEFVCRYTTSPRGRCPGRVVAVLHRRVYGKYRHHTRRWGYCSAHLYGRRLVDGVLYITVLREVP